MRSMVTGDQHDVQPEQDPPPRVIETAPVKCSCEWATMDSGSMFYTAIKRRDPDCPVHRF